MATLLSPGIDVSVTDESFYSTAGAGTIPLFVIATAANKTAPSGTGLATWTTPAKANSLYLATSQRDLVQNFGNPNFYSIDGTQIHGHELNEYGLHSAYTYLNVSNQAYVLRADIDLNQLAASVSAPRGAPLAGQYWFDIGNTSWGVFQSNGSAVPGIAWESQTVLVATAAYVTEVNGIDTPKATFGTDGNFAVVVTVSNNLFFEKIDGQWLQIGTDAWRAARPTTIAGIANPPAAINGEQFSINGTMVTVGTDGSKEAVRDLINAAAVANVQATIISNALVIVNSTGGNLTVADITGTPLARFGLASGTTNGSQVVRTSDAQYPAGSAQGDVWIKGTTPNNGAKWIVKVYNATTGAFVTLTAPFYPFDSTLPETSLLKDEAANAALGTPVVGTVYVAYDKVVDPATGLQSRASNGVQQIRRFNGKTWDPLSYVASLDAPTEDPADGTYWYNTDFRVDVMCGTGTHWVGYRRQYPNTDANGVILSGSVPTTQSSGLPLVDNDLWIDTSDLENYPALYRYDTTARRWKKIDNTDQTTPFGVIFQDARQDSGTAFQGQVNAGDYAYNSENIADLLVSDYLDPDAPDARAHPAGMLLFNTRYSNNNVKVWRPDYFSEGEFDPNTNFGHVPYHAGGSDYVFSPLASIGRWVTASGNKLDGSPYMGRKAQRAIVVKAMQAAVINNDQLRSEIIYYNLMSAPAYPELLDELISLNIEQKETAFIVTDTPIRLAPNATALINWATGAAAAPNGEDGLSQASLYTYAGCYYPWGLGTNIDGSEVMIPPSTIALSTIAYSDQVSYPWFAPAGFQRGLVTAASTVGYLTSEGEFKAVILNPGQRDVLYTNRINPIAYIPGRGLVVDGQKTLQSLASALDRINVARLVNYLKFNLDVIMKPFLFQQNDQQTRDSAKLTVQRFLAGLVTLRALEDFAVLCDTTNNTPERRDRNELWVDIAIQPVKAIEFIYVPIRVLDSASSLSFNT